MRKLAWAVIFLAVVSVAVLALFPRNMAQEDGLTPSSGSQEPLNAENARSSNPPFTSSEPTSAVQKRRLPNSNTSFKRNDADEKLKEDRQLIMTPPTPRPSRGNALQEVSGTIVATTPSAEAAPIAALREIAAQPRARSSGGPPIETRDVSAPVWTPGPTQAPSEPALSRVIGQTRGFAMLYLMHPKARATVEGEIDIMLRSEVNDLYISALVDGTFGEDYEFLNSVIRRLNGNGRTLTLALYFASGPTMRRWDSTKIRTAFSQIPPLEFRTYVEYDRGIRDAVKRLARKARPSYELNKSLNTGNQNFAIPMLEDNLDGYSFRIMRDLVQQEIGDVASIIRNPCRNCGVPGSDEETFGDPVEHHKVSDFSRLRQGDGYTLDGVEVGYPGDAGPSEVSLEHLRVMLRTSKAQGHRYFGLWRAERQGLGDQSIHPDKREYEVPTDQQKLLEMDLLREGLVEAVDTDGVDEMSEDANFIEQMFR